MQIITCQHGLYVYHSELQVRKQPHQGTEENTTLEGEGIELSVFSLVDELSLLLCRLCSLHLSVTSYVT